MSFQKVVLASMVGGALMFGAISAQAADHQVQMLNKGEQGNMVFEPSFLKIAKGDTVTFVPTNKSHDAESIEGMMPEGAKPFKGKMNQEITVTFDVEGVYGYKCSPHFAMGMVGLIQVGDTAPNLEAAKAVKVPNLAKRRLEEDFAKVQTQ
ncbi:pseudoazurin [Terrihabitans sp. B22-R8]|uniref:pseudoazurin n=1 Tax=Terrihabitans sp. B22-R8 TaxID=3425128 RepID=UPI00403C2877